MPLKAFSQAKTRLRPSLPPQDLAAVVKKMATRVIAAAGPVPVSIVSSALDVKHWADHSGIDCIDLPHANLNQAVQQAVDHKAALGVDRIVIAHADLPRAQSFERYIEVDGTVIVTDQAGRGTKVLSIPTRPGFTFHYGRLSADAHYREAADRQTTVTIVQDKLLSLDINTIADLAILRSEASDVFEQLLDGCKSSEQINKAIDQRTREHAT